MFILYKILTSFPVRIICFFFFVFVTIYWLRNGFDWCRFQSENKADKTVAKITETLRLQNPEAAAELEKMRHLHNINALAATFQERKQLDGVDGLIRLAEEGKKTRAMFDLSLTEMALKPTLITNTEQRQAFLNAHANHWQHLNWVQKNINDQNVQYFFNQHTTEYLHQLEKSSQNPDEWRRVRDNPMMVQLMISGVDRDGLEFYDREKEWLDDVLYLLLTSIDIDPKIDHNINYNIDHNIDRSIDRTENVTSELSVAKLNSGGSKHDQWTQHLVETIRKNHPYFRDAIKEYLQDSQIEIDTGLIFVFDIFERYGRTIQICINKEAIPLEELLGVMFSNPDYCERYSHSPENLAARLIHIRRQMPDVWEHADRQLVFQLADDVPDIANDLCRKFGTDDIAAFLYLNYSDAIRQASAAVNKFGDLAIYILNKYSGSELFKKYLKDFSLGVRLIPYAAMFEDKGLERLETNRAWLDKYFDTEGNPKQDKWYETLPGGGAVKVAGNWAKGYPSEWSELGWAALDVTDAALLIVSLGTSTPVTAMKTAGTTSVKIGTKTIARDTVTTVLKSGTRVTSKGSRNLAKTQKSFLFRQGIRTLAKQPLHLIPQGGRLLVQTGKSVAITPLKKLTGGIYRSARSVYVSWQGVSPATRKIVYRSLLTTGLVITLWNRTIPELKNTLPQIGEKIGALIADSAKIGAETLAAVLNGFLEQLLKTPNNSRVLPYIVYWVIVAVMFSVTFFVWLQIILQIIFPKIPLRYYK
ncbi:MAG: hypothetical protein LBP87_10280 [Planctomycetaceae bacterium]|jgi:hypothetical protein|nr:hypothetical protein [Planctomycetaceae bacterium]